MRHSEAFGICIHLDGAALGLSSLQKAQGAPRVRAQLLRSIHNHMLLCVCAECSERQEVIHGEAVRVCHSHLPLSRTSGHLITTLMEGDTACFDCTYLLLHTIPTTCPHGATQLALFESAISPIITSKTCLR